MTPVVLGIAGFILGFAAITATLRLTGWMSRAPLATVTWIDESDVIERETRALYTADAIEWDREFEAATGWLPEFSPLHAERMIPPWVIGAPIKVPSREYVVTTSQLDAIFRDAMQEKHDEYSMECQGFGLAAKSGMLSGMAASGLFGPTLGSALGHPLGKGRYS